jgi:hypothetical protein
MTPSPKGALHQVHTASNDVLEGDKTMLERAETEILGSISDWTAMHTRYSMKLAALLSALGHGSADDRSYRGTLNSAVFIKRVWITGLDKGSWARCSVAKWLFLPLMMAIRRVDLPQRI